MIMNDLIRERVEIREQFDESQKDARRDFWFFFTDRRVRRGVQHDFKNKLEKGDVNDSSKMSIIWSH